jgi:hypothetical protein
VVNSFLCAGWLALSRRGASDHPGQQNWAVARVPDEAWESKRTDSALLSELTESIGGGYEVQADDSDEEMAEGPLGYGTLVTVDLQGRGVQDPMAAALSAALPSCPPRRAVSLTVRSADDFQINDGLTDGGFTAIASATTHCKGLTGLSLGYNKGVTALGARALADALPLCHELQFLCLNGNESIRDSGAEALASALSHCKKLAVLEMLCCGLGDQGAKNLAKNLPS